MAIDFGSLRSEPLNASSERDETDTRLAHAEVARSSATTMSQHSATSKPPPKARPFTAAMSGLVMSFRSAIPAQPVGGIGIIEAFGQVMTGTERTVAGTSDYADPEIRVGLKSVQDRRKLAARGRMQCIHYVGPPHGHGQDPPRLIGLYELTHMPS